jgi:hypothetical protein
MIKRNHHGHIDTEHFGTISFAEDRMPFTGEDYDVPDKPELVLYTDTVLSDDEPNLLRSFRVVDGRGVSWELKLPDTSP